MESEEEGLKETEEKEGKRTGSKNTRRKEVIKSATVLICLIKAGLTSVCTINTLLFLMSVINS